MTEHILTYLVFTPAVAALVLLAIPSRALQPLRYAALAGTLLTLGVAIWMTTGFRDDTAAFQMQVNLPWIQQLGIRYHLGVDGISLWLLVLTALLTVLSVMFSFTVTRRVKEYMVSLLILETGMLGVFCALDLVLFYLFWELMLIPMYLLIGIWGGERRIYAAIKFFLYTFLGSALMLVAIIWLHLWVLQHTGVHTFDLVLIQDFLARQGFLSAHLWLFAAFGLAFAIKVPMFPFHTWLPDAHVEAPTAGSVILAGILLKMGTYGFMRICLPLFPEASQLAAPLLWWLAVIGIIYGAVVAAVQPDMKKLVAYSSVSHLGFVMLGLFALNVEGLTGSLLQQINHGISTGALFLLVGFLYDRRHTREISAYGGIKTVMPVYSAVFLVIMLSSVGLPATNGFVGELLCLVGAYMQTKLAIVATAGVILSAVYMLWLFQRVFLGTADERNIKLKDLSRWELLTVVPLVALVFWIGLAPTSLTDKSKASIDNLVKQARHITDASWANQADLLQQSNSAGGE